MAGGRIELISLTKRFTEIAAVDSIDLTIASGEFFSLLGPSGCGKTTTLRLIGGFEPPTAGRILLDDVDVSRVPPHKRNVNTVFQSYALFPFLTARDNVAFGLRSQKLGKKEIDRRVDEALDLVHLGPFAKRRPGQLPRPAGPSRQGLRPRGAGSPAPASGRRHAVRDHRAQRA